MDVTSPSVCTFVVFLGYDAIMRDSLRANTREADP